MSADTVEALVVFAISGAGLFAWWRLERGRDQDRAERRRRDRHPPSDPGDDEFSAQDTYDPSKETTDGHARRLRG